LRFHRLGVRDTPVDDSDWPSSGEAMTSPEPLRPSKLSREVIRRGVLAVFMTHYAAAHRGRVPTYDEILAAKLPGLGTRQTVATAMRDLRNMTAE
jgi:hypothetical protein